MASSNLAVNSQLLQKSQGIKSSVEDEDTIKPMAIEFEKEIVSVLKDNSNKAQSMVADLVQTKMRQLKHQLEAHKASLLSKHLQKISELQNSISEKIEENERLLKQVSVLKKWKGENQTLTKSIENVEVHRNTREVSRLKGKLSNMSSVDICERQNTDKTTSAVISNWQKRKKRKFSLFPRRRPRGEKKQVQSSDASRPSLGLFDLEKTEDSQISEGEAPMLKLEKVQEKEKELLESQQIIAVSECKLAINTPSLFKTITNSLMHAQSKVLALHAETEALQVHQVGQKLWATKCQEQLCIACENIEAMNSLIRDKDRQLNERADSGRVENDFFNEAIECWKELARVCADICKEAAIKASPDLLKLLESMLVASTPCMSRDEQLNLMRSQIENVRLRMKNLGGVCQSLATSSSIADIPSCHAKTHDLKQLQDKVMQQSQELDDLRRAHKKKVRNLRLQMIAKKQKLQAQLEKVQHEKNLAEETLQKTEKILGDLEFSYSQILEEHNAAQVRDRNLKLEKRCEQLQTQMDAYKSAKLTPNFEETNTLQRCKTLQKENKVRNITPLMHKARSPMLQQNDPLSGTDVDADDFNTDLKSMQDHLLNMTWMDVHQPDSQAGTNEDHLAKLPRRFSRYPLSMTPLQCRTESRLSMADRSSGLGINFPQDSVSLGEDFPRFNRHEISNRPLSTANFHADQPSSTSSRISIANRLIMNTFEEGHSLIDGIFFEKDKLQRELDEARQSRRPSLPFQASTKALSFYKAHKI